MNPDILIVRNCDGYHVLHGHLHLASVLNMSNEAIVDASGEGKVKLVKTPNGIFIGEKYKQLPLQLKSKASATGIALSGN